MRIPEDRALWLQKTLLGLDKEDWGLGYVMDGKLALAPVNTPERWQLGVDVIYRSLICDLIAVDDLGATSDRASFLRAIRTLDPCGDGAGYWHATLIWGTDRLSRLVERYFSPRGGRDGKLNPAFIEALEQIFAENAVAWSDKPLLPIMPAPAADVTRSPPTSTGPRSSP
jgi:hypothetical protein